MVAKESDGSMQRFHFFDGKFLGGWYLKGLTAKRMVSYSKGFLLKKSRAYNHYKTGDWGNL